jgi:hypothetical protein
MMFSFSDDELTEKVYHIHIGLHPAMSGRPIQGRGRLARRFCFKPLAYLAG